LKETKVERVTRWAIAGVIALLFIWMTAIEPYWLEVRDLSIESRRSPYRTIAVISDLHPRGYGSLERQVIERLRERSPELVVLAGDMVNDPEDLAWLDDFLEQLPASRKIAVLGNWEYWSGIDRPKLASLYAAHRVSLLIDYCQEGVVGLDDFTAGKPALTNALAQCGDTTPWLLVQHSPGFFDSPLIKSSSARFDLLISGHTHGGQLALFGWAPVTPEGSGRFVSGEYVTPLGRLFVTRGLGTSLLPIRLGARPELVFITIV
jgi:predicted MPP superfamily phosphohydrolase